MQRILLHSILNSMSIFVSSDVTAPAGMGLGAKPRRMSVSPQCTVKQTGRESGDQICASFQILIVSVVKICKHYLQRSN